MFQIFKVCQLLYTDKCFLFYYVCIELDFFFPGPIKSFVAEIYLVDQNSSNDQTDQQRKPKNPYSEMLAKCFISELLLLISSQCQWLELYVNICEDLKYIININLGAMTGAMKLRTQNITINEMERISDEVHCLLRTI